MESEVVLVRISYKGEENARQGYRITTILQLFSFLLKPGFGQNIHHLGADRYVKKVMTVQLIILFALAQLKKHRGLREISLSLAEEALASALNPDSISAAQLSRRMRTLPAEACTSLVQITAHAISMRCGLAAVQQELGRLYLIDSTTITLSCSTYPWAEFRKTKSGVKLHLRLDSGRRGFSPIRL
jgi:hypothetical protein